MVCSYEDAYNRFQEKWIDYIDDQSDPLSIINDAIQELSKMASQPWSHPSGNMRWLWDYLLNRKAELLSIGAVKIKGEA